MHILKFLLLCFWYNIYIYIYLLENSVLLKLLQENISFDKNLYEKSHLLSWFFFFQEAAYQPNETIFPWGVKDSAQTLGFN